MNFRLSQTVSYWALFTLLALTLASGFRRCERYNMLDHYQPQARPEVTLSDTVSIPETQVISVQEFDDMIIVSYEAELAELRDALAEREATIRTLTNQRSEGRGSNTVIENIIVEEGCTITPVRDPLSITYSRNGTDVQVPVGVIDITSDGEYMSDVYDTDINVTVATVEESTGQLNIITRLQLVNEGGVFDLPYESTTYIPDTPLQLEPVVARLRRFQAWDPALSLGLSVNGITRASVNPETYFSVMSLSDRQGDPLWQFLSLHAQYRNRERTANIPVVLGLSPFGYNVGNPMPFLRDTWFSPVVYYNGTIFMYGLTLGTRL